MAFASIGACGTPNVPDAPERPPATAAGGPVEPLCRRYVDGETFGFVMTGTNTNRDRTRMYTAECDVKVVRGDDGVFREEVRWTRLELDGREIPLTAAGADSTAPHQLVSLDAGHTLAPPSLADVPLFLVGPILDLMTFYVDLHPSLHGGKLRRAGDRYLFAPGVPGSWTDGVRVVRGEDMIEFDLELSRADAAGCTLIVKHVPPYSASLELPAPWMTEQVGARPNNWVQVTKAGTADAPAYVAAAGAESFDVRIETDATGRILTATMDNPVDLIERRCNDAALADCGEPQRYRIHRRIELKLRAEAP